MKNPPADGTEGEAQFIGARLCKEEAQQVEVAARVPVHESAQCQLRRTSSNHASSLARRLHRRCARARIRRCAAPSGARRARGPRGRRICIWRKVRACPHRTRARVADRSVPVPARTRPAAADGPDIQHGRAGGRRMSGQSSGEGEAGERDLPRSRRTELRAHEAGSVLSRRAAAEADGLRKSLR